MNNKADIQDKRMRIINAMRAKPELYSSDMIKRLQDLIDDPGNMFDKMFMKFQMEFPRINGMKSNSNVINRNMYIDDYDE